MNRKLSCIASSVFTLMLGVIRASSQSDCAVPVNAYAALDAGIAAIYVIHANSSYLDSEGRALESVAYRDVRDFLAHNPECCEFSQKLADGFAPSQEWQRVHAFYGFVTATYHAYHQVQNSVSIEKEVVRYVAITKCGDAILYDIDSDEWLN
jgi:hypothetical protein